MPQPQYYGLKTIYDTLGGAQWNWRPVHTAGAKWDFTGGYELHDPCADQWQGVNCSTNSTMSSLALSGYNLKGTLSEGVFQNFSSLLKLDFSTNSMKGKSLDLECLSINSLTTLYS